MEEKMMRFFPLWLVFGMLQLFCLKWIFGFDLDRQNNTLMFSVLGTGAIISAFWIYKFPR